MFPETHFLDQQESTGLVIDHVSFSYQKQSVLLDISMHVRPGMIVALLGKNGSGKSTIIHLVAGLLTPSTGNITFNGITTAVDSQIFLNQLGVSFDHLPEFGSLTVKEILEFSAHLRKYPLNNNLHSEFEVLGLENHMHLPVQALSKGLQKKLGVLLATFHKPNLLLLDEPTSGLDPLSLRRIRSILRSAADRGAAVLVSTHALDEVNRISDRVYIISHGQIVADGSAQEINNQVGERVCLLLETYPELSEDVYIDLFNNFPEIIETKMKAGRVIMQLSEIRSGHKDLRIRISQIITRKRLFGDIF